MTKAEALARLLRVVRYYLDRMPAWVAADIRTAIADYEDAKE